MKTKWYVLAGLLCLMSANVFSQFSFGVSPGLSFNGASFGYQIDEKMVVYGGLQYGKINYSYKVDYGSSDSKAKVKGQLFVPNIGVKYFVYTQNQIKAYTTLTLSKPMVTAKFNLEDEDVEDVLDSQVEGLKLWGGELGFGTEYFFDDNFSLGGEFGLRYIRVKSNYSYESNYNAHDVEEDLKLSLSPTYTKISLNYYF